MQVEVTMSGVCLHFAMSNVDSLTLCADTFLGVATALRENNDSYRKIRFRPRVMRRVKDVDTSTTILGVKSTVPFFIAPAALAKLGHPDGEVNLTKGA